MPTTIKSREWYREMLTEIDTRPPFEVNAIKPTEPLLRFIDLPKLFDLLLNSHLVLIPLAQLMEGDPFECYAKQTYEDLSEEQLRLDLYDLSRYAPEPPLPFISEPIIMQAGTCSDRYDESIRAMD